MHSSAHTSARAGHAFALNDLVALCAVVALLTLLHLSSLANSASKSERATCLGNIRQLIAAWRSYSDDNTDQLVGASTWSPPGEGIGPAISPYFGHSRPDWAGGSWLTLSNPRDPNNWNHEEYTKKSPLWPYLRTVAVWRCPTDPSSAIDTNGMRVLRIRSYTMNCWVGGPGWAPSGAWWPNYRSGWKAYLKTGDMTDPGPARTFVLLDEREDSINDGYWPTDMAGYPDQPEQTRIVDYPADWHNRGANLAFGDGHTETWRWKDPRTLPAHSRTNRPLDLASPNNPDVVRWQQASTRKFGIAPVPVVESADRQAGHFTIPPR